MTQVNPKFGKRIRQLREAKKIADPAFSLRRFAEALNISPTYLSKIETGEFKPPAADKIKKMAELLGDNPDELLALAEKVDPELNEIIQGKPVAMADLLRTANEENITADELTEIMNEIRHRQKK